MPVPEPLLDLFTRYIDELAATAPYKLYRYYSAREAGLWVAHLSFDPRKSTYKKLSTTVFPVFYAGSITADRVGFMELTELDQYAYAVPYTYGYDPISGDVTFPYEYEFAVYGESRVGAYAQPWTEIPINKIRYTRLIRGRSVLESDHKRGKVLPYYLHGRPYARYSYTMVGEDPLIRFLALTTVLFSDAKLRWAFGIAWDRYWEGKGLIAYPPSYAGARVKYIEEVPTPPRLSDYLAACEYSFIPGTICTKLTDKVLGDVNAIYSTIGMEVRWGAYWEAPRYVPPDLRWEAKWWYGTYDELVEEVEARRLRELREVRVLPEQDPDVVVED